MISSSRTSALFLASLLLALAMLVQETSAFVKGTMGIPRNMALVSTQQFSTTQLYAAKKGAKKAKAKKVAKKKTAAKAKAAAPAPLSPENFKKTEFIDSVAEKTQLTKAESERAITAVVETIIENVCDGKRVALNGFGSFKLSQRSARTGRNPQTGEEIQIAASVAPRFTASKKFKDQANGK